MNFKYINSMLFYLEGDKGVIVIRGYEVYHKLARDNRGIVIVGCWSHARR